MSDMSDVLVSVFQYGIPAAGVAAAALFGGRRTERAKSVGEFAESDTPPQEISTPDGGKKIVTGMDRNTSEMLQSALETISSMQNESIETQRQVSLLQHRVDQETRVRRDIEERLGEVERRSLIYLQYVKDAHAHMDDIYRGIEENLYPPLPPRIPIPEELLSFLR